MSKETMIFGLHAVQSMLKSAPQRIQKILALRGREDARLKKILDLAKKNNISIQWQTRKELDKETDGNHQGIIAWAQAGEILDEKYLYDLIEKSIEDPLILVLDGVTDPHNLGACLRTADAAGVNAVVVPKDNAVGLTETARKVACGAAETVPLIPVTNLSRTLKTLQDKGLWITGTSGDATQTLYETSLTGPAAIVLGAEGSGMRRLTREHCDYLLMIPMAGSVSSLNVSVACGVCLFEAVRQRQKKR